MTDNLIPTSPGGERRNQYEGVHTFVEPHSKEKGQLGGGNTPISTGPPQISNKNAPNTHGITPAEKIRYGQTLQEGGAGGKTGSLDGGGTVQEGFGGTEDSVGERTGATRKAQGYGEGNEMDREIGA